MVTHNPELAEDYAATRIVTLTTASSAPDTDPDDATAEGHSAREREGPRAVPRMVVPHATHSLLVSRTS